MVQRLVSLSSFLQALFHFDKISVQLKNHMP